MIAGVFDRLGAVVVAAEPRWWAGCASRFDAHWRRRVNAASALVLAAFALWQFAALAPA